MKYKKRIFILCCCFIFASCGKQGDFIALRNNAQYPVAIMSIMEPGGIKQLPQYPDTAFSTEQLNWVKKHSRGCIRPGKIGLFFENYYARPGSEIRKCYKEYNTDTISFFVFSTDTINAYSAEVVADQYKILQRYDLSLDDALFFSNDRDLTFPPSGEMRHLKMWPPYGTYDEQGYRKQNH